MESANCPCEHMRTAARLFADHQHSSLRKKLSFFRVMYGNCNRDPDSPPPHVTIYSYRLCMTLWCNALLCQAVLQLHLRNCMIYVPLLCTWPLFQNEPDCPGYPTERYTVDVDGVQVANLTADAVQSLAINHANGSVTLSLRLSQPRPENAVTLTMNKYNTVPTNRSDVKGNIVTEMVTWRTSAVFGELEWH